MLVLLCWTGSVKIVESGAIPHRILVLSLIKNDLDIAWYYKILEFSHYS